MPDPDNAFHRARSGEVGLTESLALAQTIRQTMAEDASAPQRRAIVAVAMRAARWVVVRRAAASEGQVAVGVRGTARAQRFAMEIPETAVTVVVSPEALAMRAATMRPALPVARALRAAAALLGEAGLPCGPTGSVGFELASGVRTVTPSSDLDLLLRPTRLPARATLIRVHVALRGLPARVDCQIETDDGALALGSLGALTGIQEGQAHAASGQARTALSWPPGFHAVFWLSTAARARITVDEQVSRLRAALCGHMLRIGVDHVGSHGSFAQMRHCVWRPQRPARLSGRAGAAVTLALSMLVCSCSTVVSGSPVTAAGDPGGSVPTSQLDVGNYPTTPSPPLGEAGTPETGAILEAQRMANNVIGPWEVDPALTTGYATGALVLKNTKALRFMMPEAVAAAADNHNFVNGFFSSREATGHKILQNAVLRFADAAAAVAAAADMGAAAAAEQVITAPVTSVPIAGHPDTVAMSHTLIQPGLRWTVVRSFTAHGLYVLTQLAQTIDGVDPTTALIAETIDLQTPLIDQFEITDPADFAALPIDPTGLLAWTLPLPAAVATVNQRAVYQRRGALHFQSDAIRSAELFTEAGMDWMAMSKTNVYQARDAAAAARIADGFVTEVQESARPAEAVEFMPASRCLQLDQEGFYCVTTVDRYMIEVNATQLPDAHQQVAAQYSMLTAK